MADFDGLPTAYAGRDYLWSLQYTIAAGTSQIQRNLIAERVLGLPVRDSGRSRSKPEKEANVATEQSRWVFGEAPLAEVADLAAGAP